MGRLITYHSIKPLTQLQKPLKEPERASHEG